MTDRENSGRFVKGQSGNPSGRPSKRRATHRTPSGYRLAMLEVGEMPVPVIDRETGEQTEISLLRANMIALGRKGAAGHAPSAKAFLDKHFEAAGVHGELMHLQRFLFAENAKLEIENEKMREMLANRHGGVVHVEASPEEWQRLAGIREEKWRTRKVSVNPPPGVT